MTIDRKSAFTSADPSQKTSGKRFGGARFANGPFVRAAEPRHALAGQRESLFQALLLLLLGACVTVMVIQWLAGLLAAQ